MNQENRRSFVKKSLATSISISFAGLIRAHGEEGGGTTTWNPDQTYVTTQGATTTWDPNQTTISTTYALTTWDPNQTTNETTLPVTYQLVATPKGTLDPVTGAYDSYKQLIMPGSITSVSGQAYQLKIKLWITPSNGKSESSATIEHAAEVFASPGGNPLTAAPIATTPRISLKGVIADINTPSMTAPEPVIVAPETAAIGSKVQQEPDQLTGLLANPKPADLAQSAYDYAKANKPAGATSYVIYSFMSASIETTPDTTMLPSKVAAKVRIKGIPGYSVVWKDVSNTQIGGPSSPQLLSGIGADIDLEIQVEAK